MPIISSLPVRAHRHRQYNSEKGGADGGRADDHGPGKPKAWHVRIEKKHGADQEGGGASQTQNTKGRHEGLGNHQGHAQKNEGQP
ncbi:MAG: hypothetical protein ACPHIA_06770, partial [Alphaproteobacteria bacterium]